MGAAVGARHHPEALGDLGVGFKETAEVTTAGQASLFVYLLAPLLLSVFAMSAALTGGVNVYGVLGDHLAIGTIRSALFAWLVVWLCGRMRASGVQPKL